MDKQKAQQLIEKYLEGTCTPQEKLLIERWYNDQIDAMEPVQIKGDIRSMGERIYSSLPLKRKSKERKFYSIAAAAIFLFVISFGVNYYLAKQDTATLDQQATVKEINPGGNKAYLTLSSGEQISLTDAESGDIANQAGMQITKTKDGQLVYTLRKNLGESQDLPIYNTISTPRGGQFQVVLPDGSRVWLNAESSLTYPITFTSLEERKVELRGEAYFEVAHNKEKQFVVTTISSDNNDMSQDIEVLGTHFNINSYDSEEVVKTTLLEGSVRIKTQSNQIVLKPNQQSQLKNGEFNIKTVDIQEAVAWKNGRFMFDNEKIESIMRKIARWYDVEIEFEDVDKDQVFSGSISKFTTVDKVLEKLQLTGAVYFKIDGRRIIVR